MEAKLRMQLAKRTISPLFYVFLDLKKAYDTLDRERTIAILEGYGVGQKALRFLKRIWDMDMMVPKQAGFYGQPFSASRGVRQGDIISPMIFNIVADAVVRECEVQFVQGDPNRRNLVDALFYADDGALAGENPTEVQFLLDLYTDAFARVGLKMNADKTETMVMEGGKASEKMSDYAYRRKIEGVGMSCKERNSEKIPCNLCGTHICRQQMQRHQSTMKCARMSKDYTPETNTTTIELEEPPTNSLPSLYWVDMDGNERVPCPVEHCPFHTVKPRDMRMHFRRRHLEDTIVVEQEGLLNRCTKCGLFQEDVGPEHQASKDCREAHRKRCERETVTRGKCLIASTTFSVNGVALKKVKEFKYLGRILSDDDNDGPALHRNVQRARMAWGRIGKILSKERADVKAMASIYKAIVQAVLLYGSESWVLTKAMLRKLQSFHHKCARYITGEHIRQLPDGNWYCPHNEDVLKAAELLPIEEYISRRRETVKPYIQSRPIFHQCLNSRPLARNSNQSVWWQNPLNRVI